MPIFVTDDKISVKNLRNYINICLHSLKTFHDGHERCHSKKKKSRVLILPFMNLLAICRCCAIHCVTVVGYRRYPEKAKGSFLV